jgi:soluble lytic murein transglycosylase-like protein
MSEMLSDVLARVQQLSAQVPIAAPTQTATTTPAPTTSFSDALAQASAPAAATTSYDAGAVQPAATTTPAAPTGCSDVLGAATTSPVATPTTTSTDADAAAPYLGDIDAASQKYGVDPLLLQSLIQQESGFDPNATSGAGAQGLTQLMPSTAAGLGVTNPYDPAQAIDGGAHYLADQLAQFGGNTSLALAAYNAGPGAVNQYGGVPPYPETQSYVQDILDRYQQLATGGGT